MRIAFLGLGQIGGSVARAVRARGAGAELIAWSPTGDGPRQAHAEGVIDVVAASPREAVAPADLVVLAAPADEVVALVRRLGRGGDLSPSLDADATVTDVASSKGAIVAAADRVDLAFVGGHPMAGNEGAGFVAGSADLFAGRPWVVVPAARARSGDTERVEWLARTVGAAPLRARASEHDEAVAAISHGPLVLAVALAEAVAGRPDWAGSLAARLAGGGWASMTRLGHGDPSMGAGLLVTNGAATAETLRRVREELDDWIRTLEPETRPSAAEVRDRLARVRARLEQ
ncbi:MAG TPA: prephenate dehydrogenase/arogenate dehydrogenase family protein [Candidatus Limnocylindrales bacterium]|nr:prephenate dehydrogenase/arogenate dehydrogenase family protein [Candidatus Limnocylindrales bacterium]